MDNAHMPLLIEPGVKFFLGGTLKECAKFKDRHINFFFNIGLTLFFIALVGAFLLYRYKGRLNSSEMALKNQKKQEYIVSKLQQLNFHKKQKNYTDNMITELPVWENNMNI